MVSDTLFQWDPFTSSIDGHLQQMVQQQMGLPQINRHGEKGFGSETWFGHSTAKAKSCCWMHRLQLVTERWHGLMRKLWVFPFGLIPPRVWLVRTQSSVANVNPLHSRKRNSRLLHETTIWLEITVTLQLAPSSISRWASRNWFKDCGGRLPGTRNRLLCWSSLATILQFLDGELLHLRMRMHCLASNVLVKYLLSRNNSTSNFFLRVCCSLFLTWWFFKGCCQRLH